MLPAHLDQTYQSQKEHARELIEEAKNEAISVCPEQIIVT